MDSTTATSAKLDVYSIVTNQIIKQLEKGIVPWQQPWADVGIPMNLLSKRPYRGINLWLLLSLDYSRNLFLTWDQLKKLGGSVRRGEKGHVVIFWKTLVKPQQGEQQEESKNAPLLRYYKVFNVAQCKDLPDGLITPVVSCSGDPIAECEAIIKNMHLCPPIRFEEQRAYYHPLEDFVNMPKEKTFNQMEEYYSTLFHELVHSTGHEKRLNRKSLTEMAEFGSEVYSQEELVAELGAAFLLSSANILQTSIKNNVAYIKGWLSKLQNDKRFIIQASTAAQQAVDYIVNKNIPSANSSENVVS